MSQIKYRRVAPNSEATVIYFHPNANHVYHVRTAHVPRIGEKIYIYRHDGVPLCYTVTEVIWNPGPILHDIKSDLPDLGLDETADCIITVEW